MDFCTASGESGAGWANHMNTTSKSHACLRVVAGHASTCFKLQRLASGGKTAISNAHETVAAKRQHEHGHSASQLTSEGILIKNTRIPANSQMWCRYAKS